jgi:hypothetical protein
VHLVGLDYVNPQEGATEGVQDDEGRRVFLELSLEGRQVLRGEPPLHGPKVNEPPVRVRVGPEEAVDPEAVAQSPRVIRVQDDHPAMRHPALGEEPPAFRAGRLHGQEAHQAGLPLALVGEDQAHVPPGEEAFHAPGHLGGLGRQGEANYRHGPPPFSSQGLASRPSCMYRCTK